MRLAEGAIGDVNALPEDVAAAAAAPYTTRMMSVEEGGLLARAASSRCGLAAWRRSCRCR
jgi:hypothetical protein